MTDEQRLQQHLELMHATPIAPLAGIQAVMQALRLREAGLPYAAIATVMRVYHGTLKSEAAWRAMLRHHGAAPKHYRDGPRRAPSVRRAA